MMSSILHKHSALPVLMRPHLMSLSEDQFVVTAIDAQLSLDQLPLLLTCFFLMLLAIGSWRADQSFATSRSGQAPIPTARRRVTRD